MTRSPFRMFPLMAAVSLALLACNQGPSSVLAEDELPPGSPYAGGAQHPWSDRLGSSGADPYAGGQDYGWASPTAASGLGGGLGEQALRTGENYLGDVQWTSATSGWGPIERNRSNGEMGSHDGARLSVGGQTFIRGLGVHADSDVRYALNGQCSVFTATVGIDDEVGARGRVTFQVLGDGALLYDSGEVTGSDAGRRIHVKTVGVRELQLRVRSGANMYYDHADWGEPSVTCAARQPSGTTVLSTLPYVSATNGYGPVEVDRSNGEQAQFDGRPLTIGGQTFARGLGVHASSKTLAALNYDLGGACTTLTAAIGIDDEVGDRGSVVFQVYGDGKKLYDSGVVRGRDAAQRILVDVSGVRALRLAVTDARDTMNYDHADWADATLACPPPAGRSGAPDPTFGTAGTVNTAALGTPVGVLSDDRIVLARQTDSETVLTRLGADGALDTTYGSGGRVVLPPSRTVNVYPDGRVVLTDQRGEQYPSRGEEGPTLTVSRFLAGGQPDPSFGTQGVTTLPGFTAPRRNTYRPDPSAQVQINSVGDVAFLSAEGLLRLDVSGQPDLTFYNNSRAAFTGTPGSNYGAVDFTALPDRSYAVLLAYSGGDSYSTGSRTVIIDGSPTEPGSGGTTGTRFTSPQQIVSWPDGETAALINDVGGAVQSIEGRGAGFSNGTCDNHNPGGLAAYLSDAVLVYNSFYGGPEVLCKLTAEGALDTTFGNRGMSVLRYDVTRILFQKSGAILISEEGKLGRVNP